MREMKMSLAAGQLLARFFIFLLTLGIVAGIIYLLITAKSLDNTVEVILTLAVGSLTTVVSMAAKDFFAEKND